MSEKITVNELFSGIGSQRKAFERLGIPHEVVGISEIDKYAIQSYEAIFGKTKNYGDICTAPRLDYADLWTYSFPCQDISVAGNQKGINENTRSGLLYQVQRLLEVAKDEGTLPKYLLLENVKNLVSKKFKSQFDNWLFYLDQLGYDTYWQVLNAKNYGIPQNRERVFAVSIRKDLNQKYKFPKAEPLTKKLADILEDEVDEKFYLSQDKVQSFIKRLENKDISNTIRAGGRGSLDRHQWDLVAVKEKIVCEERCDEGLRFFKDYAIGSLRSNDVCGHKRVIEYPCIAASRGRNPENPSDRTTGAPTQQRLELNYQGLSNTLTTVPKDNYVVENRIQQVNGNLYPNSGNPQAGRVYKPEGISPALDTCQGGNRMPKILDGIRIRKLSPLECWLLMGFDKEDFLKAQQSGVSNTQLYKQAGNSIVVNVLEKIFKNLY